MGGNRLTVAEKVEIVRLVGDNVRSFRKAAEEFNRRHPDRLSISDTTVLRINRMFNSTGGVNKTVINRNRNLVCDENVLNFLRNNENNAKMSLRQMSRILGISIHKIRDCFKRNKVKPFKPKFLHTLEEGDMVRRWELCLWLQGEILNDPRFLKKIIWTDEATFTTNGTVSAQNSRYWSFDNPKWVSNYLQKTVF